MGSHTSWLVAKHFWIHCWKHLCQNLILVKSWHLRFWYSYFSLNFAKFQLQTQPFAGHLQNRFSLKIRKIQIKVPLLESFLSTVTNFMSAKAVKVKLACPKSVKSGFYLLKIIKMTKMTYPKLVTMTFVIFLAFCCLSYLKGGK